MSISLVRDVLFWCLVIHFGLLVFWSLFTLLARSWIDALWSRLFRLTSEQLDALNFGGILLYKLLILVFVAVPYVALWIVGVPASP
jgi:hypothetical protein